MECQVEWLIDYYGFTRLLASRQALIMTLHIVKVLICECHEFNCVGATREYVEVMYDN